MAKSFQFNTTRSRSDLMRKIKSSNTQPEIILRKKLWKLGYRYRLNSSLPGKPDIVLPKYKIALFVDGEFWHGYDWKVKKLKIKSNIDYWIPKIERNIQRDKIVTERLIELGFTVLRFWEKQIKKNLESCILKIKKSTH